MRRWLAALVAIALLPAQASADLNRRRASFVAGGRLGYFVLPGLELGGDGALVFHTDPMVGHATLGG